MKALHLLAILGLLSCGWGCSSQEKEPEESTEEEATDTSDDAVGEASGPKSRSQRLYVGNLSWKTTKSDLRAQFSRYGKVIKVEYTPARNKLKRGFGFVTMANQRKALVALKSLKGKKVRGVPMVVKLKR